MSKTNHDTSGVTREEFLPLGPLREIWIGLLTAKREELDDQKREHQFQYADGWLKALLDVGVLNDVSRSELRELLISAKPKQAK